MVGGKVVRHFERQAEGGELGADAVRLGIGERELPLRDFERGGEAEADCLAVQEAAVAGDVLDGVGDRVAEIEQGSRAGALVLVLGDDGGLDRDVAGDERGEAVARRVRVEFAEHRGVADAGMLDDLGEALAVFAVGQGGEGGGVGQDEARLVEGADEVLAGPRVHSGLAADRAVNLRDDRGGDLDARDATLVDRGDEAGEVADHSAAEGDDERAAVEAGGDHAVAQVLRGGEPLGVFARRHREKLRSEAGGFERGQHRCPVQTAHVLVRDDGARPAQAGLAAECTGSGEKTRADKDAALGAGDGDGNLDGCGRGHADPAKASDAMRAAPTMPAWFCSWAGTMGTLTRPCTIGRNLSAFRLTPPPRMMRSGLRRKA